ncbi:glucose dehydrogenase [FAD, quinone]-like [Tribolium castaneum]|uniref:Glucose dehydrogenase [FAD, quinone]-like Protein n=1 Tax=Tribolium castaneum TaxID=7070 RepID=D2A3N6_TRICA|nr:PREDICTED: glucose dehydrogenase [FAD, quinone] isoform X1 [Tribolium castaneum]EFA05536.1 Glucose dehydrogenase [FAD, quinone]-like Protein [Tribolium castaneum]|eukprot:XP_972715.2 PREDICTED: glucose dehydrogenase [FAD, quinone] isoform X1 [Tribolium castaneum]
MLRSCVLFLIFSCAFASHYDTWPFTLADKYIEEFKTNVEEFKKFAHTYQHHEEIKYEVEEQDLTEATKNAAHYDFIIVGGGTSGAILASRLSEIPEWKILLLEAGAPETIATKVPKNWELLKNTPYNWGYVTTPQNYSCLGMVDHKCVIPTGRALGGTTSINSMVYTRGNPRDYDLWSDLGNEGWCWADVLPYYKKLEDAHFAPFDKKYHHFGGPQHLEHPQYLRFLTDHTLEAAKELDLHLIDYNGKHQIGISVPQLTSKCGKRFSTAEAYLERAEKRDNLIVKPLSQVLKVLISTHTKEAQGVVYLHEGKTFVAKAEKEVVLAAGALNTPKILLLSGVGPKEDCEKLHIHHVADLKVGHNLKIRPSFVGLDFLYTAEEAQSHDEYHDILKYLKYGKGPLTSPGIEALAFLKTNISKSPLTYPDIELKFLSRYHPQQDLYSWMKPTPKHYDSLWKPLEAHNCLKIIVTLNHPKSSGIVKLHTSNPLRPPIIEPHFLSDEDEKDYHTILAGIKKALKFSHTEAFKKIGIKLNHHGVHGCEETEFGTEAYWECAIKYLVVATEDVSGTARMGPESDHYAVVDKKLRVHGIHNLRVADASVIPVTMSGSLVGPTMVIGEKAAHIIMEEWLEH